MREFFGLDYFGLVELLIVVIILKDGSDFLDSGVRNEHDAAPILDHSARNIDVFRRRARIDPDFSGPQLDDVRKVGGILSHSGFGGVDIAIESAGCFGRQRGRREYARCRQQKQYGEAYGSHNYMDVQAARLVHEAAMRTLLHNPLLSTT
jgi:hypothetical protein